MAKTSVSFCVRSFRRRSRNSYKQDNLSARCVRAASAGDDETNDLLVSDVIRANELQAWSLSEHLVDG